jgi:bifunctional ADP-heptose synthase (sugar kinase/adenylyltransferase)
LLGYVRGLVNELERQKAEKVELVVGINSDDYIRRKKRDNGLPAEERARALLATGIVSRVEIFEEDDPREFIKREEPTIHAIGAEYTDTAVEADLCRELGVQLAFVPRVGDWSTTAEKGKYERDDKGIPPPHQGRELGTDIPRSGA